MEHDFTRGNILKTIAVFVGDVETRPAARCLTNSFRGTHGQAVPRYEQLLDYMREHNLAPAGPSREIALIDDIISDDPATYVTQITVPVTVLD